MILDLKTAPGEVFESINLLDLAKPKLLNPKTLDVDMNLWSGNKSIITRAKQMQIGLDIDGATSAEMEQFEKWQHERTFLRINGNYGADTIFYQSFQRGSRVDDSLGVQVGTEPTYSSTATYGQRTYLGDDGYLHPIDNNIPRFEDSCFGMKGVLLEGTNYNYINRSHPQSGTLNWAIDVGSPTIGWVTAMESNVYGETGVARIVMATGEKVRHLSNVVLATANHSYYVYLKGWGTVQLELYNGTTATSIGTSNLYALSPDTWTRCELLDVSGLSSGQYAYAKIIAQNTCYFYVAGDQLQQGPFPSSYIYNPTSTNTAIRTTDVLAINDLKNLTGAGTFTIGFKHPRLAVPLYALPLHWFLGDTSALFQLHYRTSDVRMYFQKRSASYKAEYTCTKATGDDVIISCLYDNNEIEIWEDGIEKDSNNNTGAIHTVPQTLYAGDPIVSQSCSETTIAFIRIDDQRLPDAELLSLAQLYTDADIRVWTNRCEGRDFQIEKLNAPLQVGSGPGQTARHKASVVLSEVAATATATLRTR